jgi:hypothetical protein
VRLLRTRRERPGRRSGANQSDELASFHACLSPADRHPIASNWHSEGQKRGQRCRERETDEAARRSELATVLAKQGR